MTSGAANLSATENIQASRSITDLLSALAPNKAIWLIVLIGGLLRFYRFDALSLWVDEGLSVLFQRLPWDTVLGFNGAYDTHPPLYYVLSKAAAWVAPELTAGRLVSVIAGTLTLPILYALARRLIGGWGGLIATSVLAISPLHIWYSQEARPYAVALLAVALSFLALIACFQAPNWRWAALYGLAISFSLYTDLSTLYAIAPQGIVLIYMLAKKWKPTLLLCFSGALGVIGFLPWVPQVLGVVGGLNGRQDSYLSATWDRISASAISLMGVGGQSSYFWGSEPTSWDRWPALQIGMLLAIVAAWFAGVLALHRHGILSLLSAICLFFGTIAVCILMSLISAGFSERTVIYALLGWALAAGAVFITPLSPFSRWVGLISVSTVIALSSVSLWAMYAGGDKQHWRELAAHSKVAADSNWTVVMYPEVTGLLLDLYYPGTFDMSLNISDYGDLPEKVRPETGTKSVWLAYIQTGIERAGGLDKVQAQLEQRGYELIEHRYFWNPMWLDHYELKANP